ncbi:MAG: iron ABC transporter permease [Myxococcales bacterium]|nr:iron ABC transporter permease [Myxococcales bacterium]
MRLAEKKLELVLAATLLAPLLAFAIGPVVVLLVRSVASLRGEALLELLSADGRRATYNTLTISAGAAGVAFLVGAPLALLLERTDLAYRGVLRVLFTLPSAIPPFIWGMGWLALANPKAGLLNRVLGAGALDIYGPVGIAFVLGGAGLPLVLLAGTASLSRVDPALEEAARLSGAGPLRALLTVSLPLALPALGSGAVMVFLFSASAFGVPYILGVTASPPTVVLTTRIYGQVLLGGPDALARALSLSAVLLLLASVLLVAGQLLGRAGRVRLAAGKGVSRRPMPLGRYRSPLSVAAAVAAFVLVLLPLFAVFLTSVQKSYGAPLGLEHLTFAHWAGVLTSPRTLSAAGRSVLLAGAAGTLVCAFGLLVALSRKHFPLAGRAVDALASWPFAVPGTVMAMALLVAFSRDLRLVLFERVAFVLAMANTLWLVLAAYAAKYLVLGGSNLSESMAQVDPSLAEAARVSGASRARAFLDATLPSLRPALASAFVLAFLACATELTMSVLLVPTGKAVLGTLLFELQSYADPNAASVLACGFVLLVVLALGAMEAVRRSARRRAVGG